MDPNEKLLAAIKARKGRRSAFGAGITTADRYVKTILDCVGLPACYKYASAKNTSFNDVLEKAARTLVYGNDEMEIEEKLVSGSSLRVGSGEVEFPKNTLMAFRHCLTSDKKDRDGDHLRTKGAILDPKMLLLWQHIHTLPIGKMLAVASHTDRRLSLVSAIVDINESAHDAAVMVDNDMARFSHGFRAIDFHETKEEEEYEREAPGGFDVKKFEIMEESVVSVPANTDAAVEEVMLSLVEGGKLHSPLMKAYGKQLRIKRPVSVPGVAIKYRETLGDFTRELECPADAVPAMKAAGLIGDPDDDEAMHKATKDGGDGTGCTCGGKKPAPEEAAGDAAADDQKKVPTVPEVTPDKGTAPDGTKRGRVLSKSNEDVIRDAKDDVDEAAGMDVPRACKALLHGASGKLDKVLSAVAQQEMGMGAEAAAGQPQTFTVGSAARFILANANRNERGKLLKAMAALEKSDARERTTNDYLALAGK